MKSPAPSVHAGRPLPADRFGETLSWVAAAGGAVLLHAAWLLAGPGDRPLGEPERPPVAPRLAYLPGSPVPGDPSFRLDVRAVWSPVLFSVPTAMGFSESQLVAGPRTLPPVPARESPGLLRPAPMSAPPRGEQGRVAPALADLLALRPPFAALPAAAPGAAPPQGPTGATLRVFLQGDPQRVLSEIPAPPGTLWADELGWEAVVWVAGGRAGGPRSALLEVPTGLPERNREVVRTARKLDLGPDPGSKRVVFRFTPAARTAAGGAEGVTP